MTDDFHAHTTFQSRLTVLIYSMAVFVYIIQDASGKASYLKKRITL